MSNRENTNKIEEFIFSDSLTKYSTFVYHTSSSDFVPSSFVRSFSIRSNCSFASFAASRIPFTHSRRFSCSAILSTISIVSSVSDPVDVMVNKGSSGADRPIRKFGSMDDLGLVEKVNVLVRSKEDCKLYVRMAMQEMIKKE